MTEEQKQWTIYYDSEGYDSVWEALRDAILIVGLILLFVIIFCLSGIPESMEDMRKENVSKSSEGYYIVPMMSMITRGKPY